MGLLYAWATKEYLLEQMSFGQIVMYHHYGLEIKYPKVSENDKPVSQSLKDKSPEELKVYREQLRKQYGNIGKG
jgi:hypothetical protein